MTKHNNMRDDDKDLGNPITFDDGHYKLRYDAAMELLGLLFELSEELTSDLYLYQYDELRICYKKLRNSE